MEHVCINESCERFRVSISGNGRLGAVKFVLLLVVRTGLIDSVLEPSELFDFVKQVLGNGTELMDVGRVGCFFFSVVITVGDFVR